MGDGTDITYNTASTYLWTAIEASVGLMCACFPIIGPMFSLAVDKFRSGNTATTGYVGFGSSKKGHTRL